MMKINLIKEVNHLEDLRNYIMIELVIKKIKIN